MSNASLKEQLQAITGHIPDKQVSSSPKRPHSGEKKHGNAPGKNRTAKKPKPQWLELAQYGVELLRAYFPDCFKAPNDIKPLKVGIKQDLLKKLSTIETIVTEDKACMVKSLSYYVNMAAYHRCVVNGATRIDLDGQPAGIVTLEEANYSVERQKAKLNVKQSAKDAPQQ